MKSCFKLRFQKLIGLGKNPKKDDSGKNHMICSSVSFNVIGEIGNTDWPSLASDFAFAQDSMMSVLMAAIASLKSADSLSARSFIAWTVSFETDSCSDLAHRLFLKPSGEPGLFWRALREAAVILPASCLVYTRFSLSVLNMTLLKR